MTTIVYNPKGRSWKRGVYTMIPSIINMYKEVYNTDVININDAYVSKSWKETYKMLDDVIEKYNITSLILIGKHNVKIMLR